MAVEVLYNGGTKVDFGTATIYPFYYYKDVTMGSGSSSVKNYPYPEYAWTNAFFLPDSGEVISTDTWVNEAVDAFARLSASNAAITSANTLNKASVTAEQYYGGAALYLPLGGQQRQTGLPESGQLRIAAEDPPLRGGQDGRVVHLRYADHLLQRSEGGGDLRCRQGGRVHLDDRDREGGRIVGSRIRHREPIRSRRRDAVQYVTYTKGAKPAADEDICKQGYMVVKEVTCGDAATGTATDLNGHVKFDFYWSKTLNE